nr:hypothetical protein [Neorhizobium galegae]
MEEALGCKPFIKSGRSVVLRNAGRIFEAPILLSRDRSRVYRRVRSAASPFAKGTTELILALNSTLNVTRTMSAI